MDEKDKQAVQQWNSYYSQLNCTDNACVGAIEK